MIQEAEGSLGDDDAQSCRSSIEVDVLGKRYAFESSYSAQDVREVAGFVNGKADSLREEFPSAQNAKISVLTVMQIAYELLSLRKKHEALEARFERASEHLLNLVNGQ